MWELKNRFIAILSALFILMAGSGIGSAAEIIVHSGESIQAAIDGASNGSVIILEPGTYNQNVTISAEGLTFMSSTGNPDDVIIQGGDLHGDFYWSGVSFWLKYETKDINFKGITFKGTDDYDCAISGERAFTGTIENCKIIDHRTGVFVEMLSTYNFINNTFINCESAIGVWEFASIYGRDNTFIDCGKMVSYSEEFYPIAIELTNSKEIHTGDQEQPEPTEPAEPTPTETPVPTPTDNGGSSGGSSGGSHGSSGGSSGGTGGSPEPQKNVASKDTTKVFIPNEKLVCFNFTNDATVIESISFTSKKTMGKTTAIVEDLKNKSTLVADLPEGIIYKSFNIWVGNAGYGESDNILNATVDFKVEKSWMEENDVGPSSITLYRYDSENEQWVKIDVTLTSEDDNYLYFTAETSGFSSFVIVGDKESATLTTESVAGEVRSAGNGTVTGTPEESPGLGIIAGIVSLLGIFYRIKGR